MAYKFSKQNILEYHQNRVEILETQLGAIVQRKAAAESQLAQMQESLEGLLNDLSNFQNGILDLNSINQVRFNIRSTQKQIELKKLEILEIQKEYDRKREEVMLAKQDEAVFDKLREKEVDAYNDKVRKQENELQSDIYISLEHRKHQMGAH